jgi:hypothetical protein
MDGNGMKGLMVMIMLSLTLFLAVVHAEDRRPLPFFTPHMPSFLHSLPLRTRILSFSSHDDAKHRMNKLKGCIRECHEEFKIWKNGGPIFALGRLRRCLSDCRRLHGL